MGYCADCGLRRFCDLKSVLRIMLAWAFAAAMTAAVAETPLAWPDHVEAVRTDWTAQIPPESGWVAVTLPDDWNTRWPNYDGVVWYRLRWTQAPPVRQLGFLLPWTSMACAIYFNGEELFHSESLVEPLTRMTNTPVYLRLTAPLLREGENVLLIRVSGLMHYRPGIPAPIVGEPAKLEAQYRDEVWERRESHLLGLAICGTLVALFLTMWMMRPKETAYGWFGLAYLLWWYFSTNDVATSPWPFATTYAYEKAYSLAFVLSAPCDVLFVLRYCDRHYPRFERAIWLCTALLAVALIAAPNARMQLAQIAALLIPALFHFAAWAWFIVIAWRGDRVDRKVMSLFFVAAIPISIHDLLSFMEVLHSNVYYNDYISIITTVGLAGAMSWNFISNLKRFEEFNVELLEKVEAARTDLAASLKHQHDLELAQSRLGERLSLAHDLHDGFGGILISNIVRLERSPESVDPATMLSVLKELRDDLRLIIDTAAGHQHGERSLADLLASLRHRMTRLFEAHDIDCEWHLAGLEEVYLSSTQSLDVLRILQEALANVFKHSAARHVDIAIESDAAHLDMRVTDDGRGFDPQVSATSQGTGLRSMRARAQRLSAELSLTSQAGMTMTRLHMPLTGKTQPRAQ